MKIEELTEVKKRTEINFSSFLLNQIEKFKNCDEVDSIDDTERLHMFTIAEIERAYGESATETKTFPKFDIYNEDKIVYKQKITSYLVEIQDKVRRVGLPGNSDLFEIYRTPSYVSAKPTSNSNISINNVNTNTNDNKQEQTVQLLLELIKDYMPADQIRAIESIVKLDESEPAKFDKVKELISKLGVEFTSSVLAKVLLGCFGIII